MCTAVFSGDCYQGRASQLLATYFLVPSNCPKSFCKIQLGPVPSLPLKCRKCKIAFRDICIFSKAEAHFSARLKLKGYNLAEQITL